MELKVTCPRENCYGILEQDGPENWKAHKGEVSIPLVCPFCKTSVLISLEARIMP